MEIFIVGLIVIGACYYTFKKFKQQASDTSGGCGCSTGCGGCGDARTNKSEKEECGCH